AGFLAGIAVVLVGVGVALAAPPGRFFGTTMDLATISIIDFHFGFGAHFVPRFVFARFEEFAPQSTLLGLLYLLPPLFLYTGGKAVSSWAPDAESAAEALLNGTTVVLGYLPVVFVVLLLVPGGAVQGRIATPLLMAGLVYPVLFGSLGGIAEHHYPADARRVGVGYGVALILLVAFLMFLWTFVVAGSLTIADRLVLTTLLLGAVQTQSGVGTVTGPAVLAVLAGIAALAIGFVRTWRAHDRVTILEGTTRPLSAAWTYALGVALIVTAIPVVADSYAARELHLGGLVSDAATEFAGANLVTIGDFVVLVVVGSVVFPVVLGGIGGLIAAVIQHRQDTRAEQAAAGSGGPAGSDQAGALTGGGTGHSPAGGSTGQSAGGGSTRLEAGGSTTGTAGTGEGSEPMPGGEADGPAAADEPLGPSTSGGRTGPEPDADTPDSGGDSPSAGVDDEVPSDSATEEPGEEDSRDDDIFGGGPSEETGSGGAPNSGETDSVDTDRFEDGFDWGDDDTGDDGDDDQERD
ncbi:MAG: hypothetical protein V5A24_06660, partial [Haloarculaceae archaeon]